MAPVDLSKEMDAARKQVDKKTDVELRTLLATTRGAVYKVYYEVYMARKAKADKQKVNEDRKALEALAKGA